MMMLLMLLFAPLVAAGELTVSEITSAMRDALGSSEVEIEVVDYSRYPAPPGTLVFERAGLLPALDANPDRVVFWRGRIDHGGNRSSSVWARVRLVIARPQLVAVDAIATGTELTAAQIEVRPLRQSYSGPSSAMDPASVIGQITTRPLQAGQPILKEWLKARPQVARGQDVVVLVSSGRAQLTMQGRAETSGFTGQQVLIRNPATGKSFRAIVKGANSVWVKGS